MSVLTGLISGFGGSLREAQEQERSSEEARRDRVHRTLMLLAQAEGHPDIQMSAVSALLGQASPNQKTRGWLTKFFQEQETSPYIPQLQGLLTGKMSAALPASSKVETKRGLFTPPTTPPPTPEDIYKADIEGRIATGADPEMARRIVHQEPIQSKPELTPEQQLAEVERLTQQRIQEGADPTYARQSSELAITGRVLTPSPPPPERPDESLELRRNQILLQQLEQDFQLELDRLARMTDPAVAEEPLTEEQYRTGVAKARRKFQEQRAPILEAMGGPPAGMPMTPKEKVEHFGDLIEEANRTGKNPAIIETYKEQLARAIAEYKAAKAATQGQ